MHAFTSQRWPIIGASAQLCSAFRPIVPFLYMIRLKDLSNHLKRQKGILSLAKQAAKQVALPNSQVQNMFLPFFARSLPVVALAMQQGLGEAAKRII